MFLAWLPIIGPLIDGLVSIFKAKEDTKVKLDTNDVEVIKARATLIATLKDDVMLRLSRDLILLPTSVWTFLIVWDKIVAKPYPHLIWGVTPIDSGTGIEFLPMAVLAFLFGLSWRGK